MIASSLSFCLRFSEVRALAPFDVDVAVHCPSRLASAQPLIQNELKWENPYVRHWP